MDKCRFVWFGVNDFVVVWIVGVVFYGGDVEGVVGYDVWYVC